MIKNLFIGLGYNFKGFGFFITNRTLWKFAIIPLFINLLALILLIALYVSHFGDIFAFITKPLGSLDITAPNGFFWHLADGLFWFLRFGLKIVFFALSFVLIFMLVFILSGLVNAPFYELLAEQVLTLKNEWVERPFQLKSFLTEMGHSLKIELCKLVLFVALSLMILVLSSVPVIGVFFGLIGIVFAAWFFAFGLSSFPLVLQRKSFKDILGWAWQNNMLLTGLGLPATIPVVGMLFLHFQVIGGTLLYIDHKQPEHL
ncbi:MAG: hypothetical protein ACD_62C00058G0007 [uncultured bacterium]|nr:MAG: hypothetical protein ACD_62C00058G0007 [uncultured bacterium]HLD45306.1 EI24 domain-containing protein [bacterium]